MSVVDTGHRFELTENGFTAFATYRRSGDAVTIPHVEAPKELQGKGTAGRLMEGIVALARAQGFKIVPTCPYAVAWFKRHPDARDAMLS
jgi:predicted GNAT family acetyltransferase